MSVSTISTYGSIQNQLAYMNQTQTDLNNAETQVSSGQKSQTFEGISSSVEQFSSLNSQITRLANYSQQNTITIGQLQTTNNALTQVLNIANDVKSLITTQISGTSSSAAFNQQLSADMSTLAATLNTNYSGKYIFGGTNTSTPPVTTPVPASIQTGTPDAGYYVGSNQDITARISDNQTITPNIKANDPSFQNLIAGINQALSATGTTRASSLQSAENLVDNGINGLISLQANVNANVLTTQNANTQSSTLTTYYKGVTSNINDADIVSLSTQVSQDTVVLQTSYSVFAKIASLSLVNFLK